MANYKANPNLDCDVVLFFELDKPGKRDRVQRIKRGQRKGAIARLEAEGIQVPDHIKEPLWWETRLNSPCTVPRPAPYFAISETYRKAKKKQKDSLSALKYTEESVQVCYGKCGRVEVAAVMILEKRSHAMLMAAKYDSCRKIWPSKV